MSKAKLVSTPLANHFKLSSNQCPRSDKEKDEMKIAPYASAIGSLMYVMVYIRPDIAYSIGVMSAYLSNPGKDYLAIVKWIFWYPRGTSKVCLCFGNRKPMLEGSINADMVGDIDS